MVDKRLLAERRKAILALAERYGVYDVRVFGSIARGESGEKSDVDLLVKVRPGRSLFDLGGFLMPRSSRLRAGFLRFKFFLRFRNALRLGPGITDAI